jgi:pyruvyltransferase
VTRVRAYWCPDANWGDQITPVIIERLSGRWPVTGRGVDNGKHLVVGSIIQRLRPRDHVWGTGGLSLQHLPKRVPPTATFHAVRGPLIRMALQKLGAVGIPEVFGDPGLLASHMFPVKGTPKYAIGLLPHYVDYPFLRSIQDPAIRVIDIRAGVRQVIEMVASCEVIVATALHGVILGESYGKPTSWAVLDEGRRIAGWPFKFHDHFSATCRTPTPALLDRFRRRETVRAAADRALPPPPFPLEELLRACPFTEYRKLQDIPKTPLEAAP